MRSSKYFHFHWSSKYLGQTLQTSKVKKHCNKRIYFILEMWFFNLILGSAVTRRVLRSIASYWWSTVSTPMHYGLSPIEKGDIKNFAKWVPRPPFLVVKIVSDKKYLGKTIWSVSLSFIIWYELILKNNERFDTFILFEDQLNVSLKSDCKYFRTYFQMKMVKKIFVRYLPHEGGLWQKCYFLLFFFGTSWLANTQNFRFVRPPLHVFCK